jgi:amino acid transporter
MSDEPVVQPDRSPGQTSKADDEVTLLHRFGYRQRLRRSMGLYSSFSLGFAGIAITVTVFTLFGQPFQTLGGSAIWFWVPITLGSLVIACVWGHLVARVPVTGYAYSWVSRIVNPSYGWFCGWTELAGWLIGTAAIALSAGSVFSSYFWANPTHHDQELFAAIVIVIGVVANIISIKVTSVVNNISASAELFGTLGLGLLMAVCLPFLGHVHGPGILFQVGNTTHTPITLSVLALATLLPIYTISGWDASADLAEETHDPRRNIPKAMRRAVLAGGIGGFFLFAVYAMAIRGSVAHLVNSPQNPLIAVFTSHFGHGASYIVVVIAGFAMFSAILANIAAAGRVAFALSRDKMLPASGLWSRVSETTHTPVYSLIAVGLFAELANFASAGIINRIIAAVSVMFAAIYVLVMVGVLYGHKKGRIPSAPPGYFDMGRWLVPGAIVALLYAIGVGMMMTLPVVNHVSGQYFLIAEAVGVLWFITVLARRLRRGDAGPGQMTAAADTEEIQLTSGANYHAADG